VRSWQRRWRCRFALPKNEKPQLRFAVQLRTLLWDRHSPNRARFATGGFTEPRGSRQKLGELVLGVYDGDDLAYIGHTGGGFDGATLEDVYARLEPLIQEECPFQREPATNARVHWVRPELVCEVELQEWTDDGRMRQPIFLGLREDKRAREVRREEATAPPPSRTDTAMATGDSDPPETSGPQPKLTHLDKVYWPADGLTKGDLIEYYRTVASVLLPYLRDRPQSLHRHPNGITAKGFFPYRPNRRGRKSGTFCARTRRRCSTWPTWVASS
jgi:bifunctional non-homologous end joining protein LigD